MKVVPPTKYSMVVTLATARRGGGYENDHSPPCYFCSYLNNNRGQMTEPLLNLTPHPHVNARGSYKYLRRDEWLATTIYCASSWYLCTSRTHRQPCLPPFCVSIDFRLVSWIFSKILMYLLGKLKVYREHVLVRVIRLLGEGAAALLALGRSLPYFIIQPLKKYLIASKY